MTTPLVPHPPQTALPAPRRAAMTPALYLLIAAAVALSLVHHLDHVVRGATGWPVTDEVNPFTYSLAVYPVIALQVLLSVRGLVGPRSWSFLSVGGALFVTAVHVGPAAGDLVTAIPGQYASPVVGVAAVALLAALVAVLVGTAVYERRLVRTAAVAMAEGGVATVPDARPRRALREAVRAHPIVAYAVVTCAVSWSWWIPLARSGAVVEPAVAGPLYIPGLLGPAVGAIVVTAVIGGRAGLRDLAARALRWRVAPRWYAIAVLGPLAALAVAVAVTGDVPDLAEFGRHPALPALAAPVVWLFAVLVNGLGEEVGWRGFALPHLQHRHSSLRAVGILALLWAGWHAPVIGSLASFRDRGLSGIVAAPLFTLGIACLTVALVWLTDRSGSVLIAALAHGTYNMVSATAAAEGAVGTVATVLVMVGAAVLVVRQLRSPPGAGPLAVPRA